MRRMVKENLLKFDATPLFPERIATTVPYKLSTPEAQLYKSWRDARLGIRFRNPYCIDPVASMPTNTGRGS